MMKKLWIVILGLLAASVQAADDKGRIVYVSMRCDGCHGGTGRGMLGMARKLAVDPMKLNLTQIPAGTKDADLKNAIEKGKAKMPPYGGRVKPEDIDAVVAYIRSIARTS